MNISKIDHIGIATKNLDEAMKVYQALGLRSAGIETVEEQKVKVAFLPCGESELELLEPTEQSSPVAAFIEKKGEGIHHIALRVDDLEKALEELKQLGIRLIDEKPRYGAGGSRIAFLHPKATNGVLVELSERKEEE